MKPVSLFVTVVLCVLTITVGRKECEASTEAKKQAVISEQIRFCESTYPYDGGILVANFGTEQLNPLNSEGKGYVVFVKEGKSRVLIPTDGNLSAPKGMCIVDHYLFICDVNKVVVYDLQKLQDAPQTIRFPEDDLFINDLVFAKGVLYASVTNSGRIYRMKADRLTRLNEVVPEKWAEVVGANGLLLAKGTMYVASYPADGKTTDANVIYEIRDMANPIPQPFISVPGQYDGIAMSADKKTMYVTNWVPAGVSAIDMKTKEVTPLKIDDELIGAADITVVGDVMYIPDLPNSRVVVMKL